MIQSNSLFLNLVTVVFGRQFRFPGEYKQVNLRYKYKMTFESKQSLAFCNCVNRFVTSARRIKSPTITPLCIRNDLQMVYVFIFYLFNSPCIMYTTTATYTMAACRNPQ